MVSCRRPLVTAKSKHAAVPSRYLGRYMSAGRLASLLSRRMPSSGDPPNSGRRRRREGFSSSGLRLAAWHTKNFRFGPSCASLFCPLRWSTLGSGLQSGLPCHRRVGSETQSRRSVFLASAGSWPCRAEVRHLCARLWKAWCGATGRLHLHRLNVGTAYSIGAAGVDKLRVGVLI